MRTLKIHTCDKCGNVYTEYSGGIIPDSKDFPPYICPKCRKDDLIKTGKKIIDFIKNKW